MGEKNYTVHFRYPKIDVNVYVQDFLNEYVIRNQLFIEIEIPKVHCEFCHMKLPISFMYCI